MKLLIKFLVLVMFGVTLGYVGAAAVMKASAALAPTEPERITFSYGEHIDAQARAYRDGREDAIRECSLFGYVKLGEHIIPCLAPFPTTTQEM